MPEDIGVDNGQVIVRGCGAGCPLGRVVIEYNDGTNGPLLGFEVVDIVDYSSSTPLVVDVGFELDPLAGTDWKAMLPANGVSENDPVAWQWPDLESTRVWPIRPEQNSSRLQVAWYEQTPVGNCWPILRYTGGIENPMAIFYLFHVMIAALLLGAPRAVLQGVWAVGLYAALGVGECAGWITPHYPFLSPTASAYSDWVFVLTGVGVLGAGVFGTLYFATQISSRLEEQEAELQESNLAVRNNRDAISQLQERRSRFMRTAAHQLKSPLTGIEMLAGLIRDKVVPPPRVQDVIARIIGRCRQALVQVNELLTLERIEQAVPVRHRASQTDLAQVVLRVGQRFAEQAESERVTLNVQADQHHGLQAAVAECDLEDCIANLIDNAIKYTPADGRIDVTTSYDDRTVSVSVRDNGIGIARPDRDGLFEPFRRGNEALAADLPGTGLGLAIVKEVVEQAGGRVEVQSTPGTGTEFVVTFARCDSDNCQSARNETDKAVRDHPAPCIG